MINYKPKLDFNDLAIQPAIMSNINSRSEISILDENGMLPIFTAPMFDVVDEKNIDTYNSNKIYGILPRKRFEQYSEEYFKTSTIKQFIAVGLSDFEHFFVDNKIDTDHKYYILIDIANGHMYKLVQLIVKSKNIYGDNLVLMVGNVANPETYKHLTEAGADYIRLGIGGGFCCLTSSNGSINYPYASLIDECYQISCTMVKPAKIIADGGISSYSEIIKALALGADFVMLGSILNKSLESSGKFYDKPMGNNIFGELDDTEAHENFKFGRVLYKKYRGMSTKEVQRELGKEKLTTSEGIVRYNKVEYRLSTWVENFQDYLKSNMSYTGFRTLEDFKGNVVLNVITQNAFNRFNK